MRLIGYRNPGGVHPAVGRLAELHPAAPPSVAHASVLPWLVAAIVLALVVTGGVYLSSRH